VLDEENGFIHIWEAFWEPLLPIRPGSARCARCDAYLKEGQRWQERPVNSLQLFHVDAADCPPLRYAEDATLPSLSEPLANRDVPYEFTAHEEE
jgi:hypothetical protein